MAQKKSKQRPEEPLGQCLTRPVPNDLRPSGFWLVPEKHKFSGTNQKPERRRPFGTGLVRHCPQGLFSPFFTFLRALFFPPFRLSFAPTISAPGSPRMGHTLNVEDSTEDNNIGWKKSTVFALFYFVFEGNFQVQAPAWRAYIWRGNLTEGFLRYRFGARTYIWRG